MEPLVVLLEKFGERHTPGGRRRTPGGALYPLTASPDDEEQLAVKLLWYQTGEAAPYQHFAVFLDDCHIVMVMFLRS
jgi:hypothetical protein